MTSGAAWSNASGCGVLRWLLRGTCHGRRDSMRNAEAGHAGRVVEFDRGRHRPASADPRAAPARWFRCRLDARWPRRGRERFCVRQVVVGYRGRRGWAEGAREHNMARATESLRRECALFKKIAGQAHCRQPEGDNDIAVHRRRGSAPRGRYSAFQQQLVEPHFQSMTPE